MRVKLTILLMCILFPCSVFAANDFSADANCYALWRFESGAMTADSKSTNTLTDVNTVNESTGVGGFKEGSCAALFVKVNNERFTIADASLSAGFPLKNGDAVKKISICFWFRATALGIAHGLWSKASSANKASFEVYVTTANKVRLMLGYNNGDSYEYSTSFGTAFEQDKWYHVGITFQDSDKSYRIRVWDDTAGAQLGADITGNFTNAINIEDDVVWIGRGYNGVSDATMDEMVVFNDVLTADEIDLIRAGTYGAGAPASVPRRGTIIFITNWLKRWLTPSAWAGKKEN